MLVLSLVLGLILAGAATRHDCGTSPSPHISTTEKLFTDHCKLYKRVCVDQGVLRIHDPDLIRGDSLVQNISKEEKHTFQDYIQHAALDAGACSELTMMGAA